MDIDPAYVAIFRFAICGDFPILDLISIPLHLQVLGDDFLRMQVQSTNRSDRIEEMDQSVGISWQGAECSSALEGWPNILGRLSV